MKKIRLAMIAAAFILATGAAYATSKAKVGLPDCSTGRCVGTTNQCCVDANSNILPGNFVHN
ncbi:hypothetical protein [Mucilaginibacter ginsenosidivorans]|uniref:Uncharacterized protein n=1 Tax=Mucilaginibacter ginsenosidivorans TaxID=398053 RepID=A0A5B8UT87_9SPHI|nr:hypothetical protein [Mucilaginibacter ginsenosidivorans]QEC61935.1 hypothetical protein FRZ54_04825 [Mucilaginibacter ginsenosidivorans]